MRAAGKLGRPKQLSRSHEHARHINACNRHPGDAAVPSRYLKMAGAKTYATTYALPLIQRQAATDPLRPFRWVYRTSSRCSIAAVVLATDFAGNWFWSEVRLDAKECSRERISGTMRTHRESWQGIR